MPSAPTADMVLWGLLGIVVVQRLSELRVAKRNEAWAREQGALEYGARHYPAFFVLHTSWLVGWTSEAWLAGPVLSEYWPAFVLGFGMAEALRYWAIGTLGKRWNTRVLVLPGKAPIRTGPYRLLRHPNYLAVAIELAVVPLIFDAWVTAAVATALNAALLLGVRIPAENRALSVRKDP